MTSYMRRLIRLVEGAESLRVVDNDDWSVQRNAPALYHGTSSKFRASVLSMGVVAPSHWSQSVEVARYFARGAVRDHGGRPMVLKVALDRFEPSMFAVDDAMIDFPIFDDYDERAYRWEQIEAPIWQDSLRLYHAVVYRIPMPVERTDIIQ